MPSESWTAPQIKDLQYWYEGAQFSPWLTGKLLETLKLIGRGWEQTTETDPNTGKEQIVVTCNHPPSNISALLVVDPESKLVRRAKTLEEPAAARTSPSSMPRRIHL